MRMRLTNKRDKGQRDRRKAEVVLIEVSNEGGKSLLLLGKINNFRATS